MRPDATSRPTVGSRSSDHPMSRLVWRCAMSLSIHYSHQTASIIDVENCLSNLSKQLHCDWPVPLHAKHRLQSLISTKFEGAHFVHRPDPGGKQHNIQTMGAHRHRQAGATVVPWKMYNYNTVVRTKRTKIVPQDTHHGLKIYLNCDCGRVAEGAYSALPPISWLNLRDPLGSKEERAEWTLDRAGGKGGGERRRRMERHGKGWRGKGWRRLCPF